MANPVQSQMGQPSHLHLQWASHCMFMCRMVERCSSRFKTEQCRICATTTILLHWAVRKMHNFSQLVPIIYRFSIAFKIYFQVYINLNHVANIFMGWFTSAFPRRTTPSHRLSVSSNRRCDAHTFHIAWDTAWHVWVLLYRVPWRSDGIFLEGGKSRDSSCLHGGMNCMHACGQKVASVVSW